jgi:shikimate dehydrogenase
MDKAAQAERLFGLIGFPLSHSFSKKYFAEKFQRERITDAYYELFPIASAGQLPQLLQRYPNLQGLNVTIPYKQAVLPYLDQLEDGAAEIGAVNTIRIDDGLLSGYNTDVYGFQNSLHAWLLANKGTTDGLKAVILGTGGAAKAVSYALQQLQIPFRLVSRRPQSGQWGYELLDLRAYQLIVNTTPLGMPPYKNQCPPIPYEQLGEQHYLYDLVYNPERTLFMQRGADQGAKVKNGAEMLIGQAEKAWQIWNR